MPYKIVDGDIHQPFVGTNSQIVASEVGTVYHKVFFCQYGSQPGPKKYVLYEVSEDNRSPHNVKWFAEFEDGLSMFKQLIDWAGEPKFTSPYTLQ